jgi:hypothetical protein
MGRARLGEEIAERYEHDDEKERRKREAEPEVDQPLHAYASAARPR